MLDAAPPGRCADLLAAVLMPPPATRLAVLDAVDVPQRLHLALSLVKVHMPFGSQGRLVVIPCRPPPDCQRCVPCCLLRAMIAGFDALSL